jgi:hypothetical protein
LKPLAIDLFCGLGGWTEGLLTEGYDVVGFDIERHSYGDHQYPAQLVLQDVLTIHGKQFKDATLIVASPPCQEFSYMAMPWSLAKEKERKIKADLEEQKRLTALFDACFRIQREAISAAGRFIPLVVENVCGAQKWVGRAKWHYGSFYLWGDVPALMPITFKPKVPGFRFDGSGKSFQSASVERTGIKAPGMDWSKYGQPDYKAEAFNDNAIARLKGSGIKQGGEWWHVEGSISRTTGSKSPARKAASAMIAKIPLPLARHIARVWKDSRQLFEAIS